MTNVFRMLAFSIIFVSVCDADEKFGINDFSELIGEFSRLCFPGDEPAALSDCQGAMSEKIDSYDNLEVRKLVELAALQVTLYYAKEADNTQLYESTRADVENRFFDDLHANLLTRVYATTLLDQGRYLEAYALQERSALVENNEVTHQTAAIMLSEITIRHLHELEIFHLQRAVELSSTDQRRLLFGIQLHRALTKYNEIEKAKQLKSKLAGEEDYREMAVKYATMLVDNEITNKEAPQFCETYSFALIDEEPCRAFIAIFEGELAKDLILPDQQSTIKSYLRSSYFSLVDSERATEEELSRFSELTID